MIIQRQEERTRKRHVLLLHYFSSKAESASVSSFDTLFYIPNVIRSTFWESSYTIAGAADVEALPIGMRGENRKRN